MNLADKRLVALLEQEKTTLLDAVKTAEKAHADLVASHKKRIKEIEEKISALKPKEAPAPANGSTGQASDSK